MPLGTEYEVFEYKHFDEPALPLEEAAAQAARLRQSDPNNVYRVVAESDMSGFKIVKVSIHQAYGEAWGRMLKHFVRYFFIPRRGW